MVRELRFCVDYWKLNEVTLNDSHPIPNIADILDSMGGATHFLTFIFVFYFLAVGTGKYPLTHEIGRKLVS